MTDLRKAAEMALDALLADPHEMVVGDDNHMEFKTEKAIEALRQALAQPEQEPVAWKYDWYGHKSEKEPRALVKDWIASVYSEVSDPTINAHNIRPLYAAPPRKPWVGLTDDERNEMINKIQHDQFTRQRDLINSTQIITEMYLKEKNA